jgi:hypothetical protein
MQRKDYSFLLGVAAGTLLVLVSNPARVSFVGRPAQALAGERSPTLDLFREVYQVIRDRYVDSQSREQYEA